MSRKSKKTKQKEILIASGYSEADIKAMDIEAIEKAIDGLQSATALFQDITPAVIEGDLENLSKEDAQEIAKSSAPDPTSPEWTAYVLSLFTEDELIEKSPRVDALRRVALSLLGPFSEVTQIIQVPEINNANRATAITTLKLRNGLTYTGCADACSQNTDLAFAKYPVAVAETRALGRAFRRALMLVHVLAAEEKTDNPADSNDDGQDKAPSSMLNSLKHIASRLSIDLAKLALNTNMQIQVIEDLTKREALILSNKLSKYSTKEEQIPNDILVS